MRSESFFSKVSAFTKRINSLFSLFSPKKTESPLPPVINEQTKLSKLIEHYPLFEVFLKEEFAIELSEHSREFSLHRFTKKFPVPPAQVLFMEFQLRCRTTVRKLTARDLKKWLEIEGGVLLDARENWERQWGVLPHSHPLDPVKLEEILQTYPKDTPLVVYCHYGVRSMDAATYLADQGFKNVQTLAGGVEAWSMQVDPSFPRYPGHPC